MEDVGSLKDILQGDQMAKLDSRDAHFSVSIVENHQKFLQFYWRNQLFQFICLPFRLSSAPYVFTKLLRPILTFLRDKGVRCLMYLDDMLILGRTAEELNHNFTLEKIWWRTYLKQWRSWNMEYSTEESSANTGVRCLRPGLGSSVSQPDNIDR